MEIDVRHLEKTIRGKSIYSDVNMKLVSGNIYGLVGANGSGKTMFLRTLAGMIIPTGGALLINGKPVSRREKRLYKIGLLLENALLYPEMTGYQTLDYLGNLCSFTGRERIVEVLEAVGLDPDDTRRVQKYSLGMRQKLSIAQAVLEEPELLLLDEPTNGLDAISVEKVRRLIRQAAENGSLVVLASHNAGDIQELCNSIYQVSDGVFTLQEEE